MKIIVLDNNEKVEVDIFLNFLHNKEYPQHRNIIFSCFPELKTKIDLQKEDENSAVGDFLKVVREKNKTNIQKSIAFIKKEVEKNGEEVLKILVELMSYKCKSGNENYFLMPTILPFSPFREKTFFFSIYGSLKGVIEHPKVLAVSAHEISHFILFDILEEKNIKLNKELLYFVKELIAPILVYQDDFNGIFKKQVVGNYNVLEIYFESNNRTIKAFDYFLQMFADSRLEKKDFVFFLEQMLSVCKKIELEIKGKRDFDNKYGTQIMKIPALLNEFRKPIKL